MKVICCGDSNIYGYDPRSYFGSRYPADSRWVDILAAKTGWEVINAGENGRKIPSGAISVPDNTDLLIIMLGTNDLLQGADADLAAARMEAFLSGLNWEKGKILLIAPPPMQLGEWTSNKSLVETSILLAQRYQELSKRLLVRFADAGKWKISLAFDGVHFTEEGHKTFAEGLIKELYEDHHFTGKEDEGGHGQP